MSHLVSARGHFLMLQTLPKRGDTPVVTVECCSAWRSLYVVADHGEIGGLEMKEIRFAELHLPAGSLVEHSAGLIQRSRGWAVEPSRFAMWAVLQGYAVDPRTIEMLIGRWIRVNEFLVPGRTEVAP